MNKIQKRAINFGWHGDKKKEIKVEVNISGFEEYKAKLNEVLEIIANLEQNIEQLNQIKLEITF